MFVFSALAGFVAGNGTNSHIAHFGNVDVTFFVVRFHAGPTLVINRRLS